MIRVIRDTDSNATKKALKKFLSTRKVETQYIKGDYTILRYRKYPEREEVDIEFKGQIAARYHGNYTDLNWFDSSIKQRATRHSVNGLLRRQIYNDLRQSLNYFGVKINEQRFIKKIIWK
jgi:hypothetical protein